MCVLSGLLRWKKWVFIFDYLNGFLVAVDCPKFINHTPYNWVPIIHQSHECFQFQQAHNALGICQLEFGKFQIRFRRQFRFRKAGHILTCWKKCSSTFTLKLISIFLFLNLNVQIQNSKATNPSPS